MRRTAAWKPIAGVAAATIAIAGFGVAPATAAPDDPEQALAQVLGSNLLAGELIDSGLAYAGTSETPNPAAEDLNISALSALELELIQGLQLPLVDSGTNSGLLSLGSAGVLSSYASTSSDSSIAASGILGTGGAIGVDTDPPAGTAPTASVDLTQALDRLGISTITDDIVSELSLELGAFAARAETDGTTIDDEYALADLTLELDSPTVGALATAIDTDLTTTTTTLNTTLAGLAGPGGAIDSAFSALNLQVSVNLAGLPLPTILGLDASGGQLNVTLPDLTATLDTVLDDVPATPDVELVSDGVTLNLTQGTVSLDLETLAGGLDELDPNTSLLTPAVLTRITTAVTTLLGGITGNVTQALEDVIDETAVTLVVPVDVEAAGIPVATTNVNVSGTLDGFLQGQGTVSVTDTTILSLDLGVDALASAVLGVVSGPVLTILGGLVNGALSTADTGVSNAVAALGVAAGTLLADLTPVFDALDDVARITVNAQPTELDEPVESDLGPDGFTVRALELVLLPGLAGLDAASITLGSASVLNVEPSAVAGSLELTPPRVHEGDDVTIAGSGWNPDGGPVTVSFVDESNDPVGTPITATLDGEGTISGTFPVPDPTTLGTLTGTATQDGAPASATVEVFGDPVIIVEPEPPIDPGTTVTIRGEGFVCGPLTVEILDGDTVIESFEDVEVSELDGSWSVEWPVPGDLDVSQVTVRAFGSGECDEDEETPVDVDLPEDFDVTQAEARVGDVLDITGDGWTVGTDVTVTFTNGTTQVGVETIDPGTDGSIVGTFEVPTTAPTGELLATAEQGDDSLQDTVQIFGEAAVTVDPTSVRAGGSVDVDGTGWLPNGGPVVVTATNEADEIVGTVTIPQAEIGTGGTIADVLTIDANADAGPVTVTAVQGDANAEASLTVLPEPTVTVFPGTVRPGDEVTIGGSNWGPGTVTVVFEYEDGSTDTVPIDPVDGTITGTYPVPGDAEAGPVAVTATQGDDEATTELEITLAPTVNAAPPQVHGGDTVTIGGTGWGTAPVTVTITDGPTTIGTELVLTPVDGVISGPYLIPEGTDPADLTVTADDDTDTATTTVEVLADAVVDADPDPVDPGSPVTITGTGFLCGPVDVVITSGGTQVASFLNVTVLDNEWTQVWTVPAGIAVDSVTITATTSESATCDDEGETELEIDLDETLAAAPSIVQRGQTVTLTGTGFSDGAVSIIARSPGGAVVGSFTATSANASFTQGFYVLGNVPLGTLTFTAVQGSAVETASVTVVQVPAGPSTLIVSPSTVEPGDVVAIDGSGWNPTAGPVAITIRGANGATIGTVSTGTTPVGGLATASFTVPAGTAAPQVLTATAVQGPRTASDQFSLRQANLPVIRLAGPDRFETAVEISRDAFPFGADTVYLANAVKFPDALSAAPAAAQQDAPLLLTRLEYLEPSVIAELDRLRPDTLVVVGDENSVSANVLAQAAPYVGTIVRLGGADRFETSLLIADYAFNGADSAYIATGFNFPDALTAGAAAGAANAPMLLTHGATPSPALVQTLRDLGVSDVYIAGDPLAVSAQHDTALVQAGFRVGRYAGADRYDTGVLVAQDSFSGSADRIYVATGIRFPDALAGSAIAGSQGVPVYVSPPNCLWGDVLDEIDRLGDPQVVLLGDELALDANVFALRSCG